MNKIISKLVLIAIAGSMGSLLRFGLSSFIEKHFSHYNQIPTATIIINCFGCFLFGLIWGLAEYKDWISDEYSIIILVGFLGAFTTFSSYAFDITQHIQKNQLTLALGLFTIQNFTAILLTLAGILVSKRIV